MTTKKSILWAAAALTGCLDLDLLDDLQPMDAGTAAADVDSDADGDADGDGDTEIDNGDADGDPPASDPDDTTPPALVPLTCGANEREASGVCVAEGPISVSLRLATDEPAALSWSLPAEWRSAVLSAAFAAEHHLTAAGPAAGGDFEARIAAEDASGNRAEVEVSVHLAGGPAVAITEILADPFGAEPAQELVEIANHGTAAVDLSGWMIDDCGDRNGSAIPNGTELAPGEVALLVSPSFDPASADDPAPAAGAKLIVLAGSVGSNGLKNTEAESVELYDAAGQVVSRYAGQAGKPVEGNSAVRLLAELPDGDAAAFALEPGGGATPGLVERIE